jgi:hypothetical protein
MLLLVFIGNFKITFISLKIISDTLTYEDFSHIFFDDFIIRLNDIKYQK